VGSLLVLGEQMYRLALLALLALVLAGCANSVGCSMGFSSPDCAPGTLGYQEQQQAQAKSAATDAANAAQDDAHCRAQGLQPNTPAYEQCLSKLADQRTYEDEAERSGVAGRLLGRSPMNN
jgi:hypothetical protein